MTSMVSKTGNSKCPGCGNLVDGVAVVRYDSSFPCPTCMTELKVPAYYKILQIGISLGVSYFLGKSMGLHKEGLLVGLSGNRRSQVLGLHMDNLCVYQDIAWQMQTEQ
jgi:hypothetical protein